MWFVKLFAVIAIIFIIALKFGPQLLGATWDIGEERDKLTDEVTLAAQKSYKTEAGSKIQVTARCHKSLGSRVPAGLLPPGADMAFIELEFIDSTEALERKEGGAVASYRLDAGGVKMQKNDSKYNNVATINFFRDARISDALTYFTGGALTSVQLATGQTLRVELPVVGKEPADIQIDLIGLRDFFRLCPIASPAQTSPVPAQSDANAQPAPTSPSPTSPEANPPHPATGAFTSEKYMAMNPYEKGLENVLTTPIPPDNQATAPQNTTPSSASASSVQAPVSPQEVAQGNPSTPPVQATAIVPPATSPDAGKTQAPTATAPVIPAINCQAPDKSTIDVLVCSSPQLVTTDAQINAAYYQLRHSLAPDAAAFVKQYQKNWLAKRGENCGLQFGDISEEESKKLISCLQDLYNNRLSALQAQLRGAR